MTKYTFTLIINYDLHRCTEQYDTIEAAKAELVKVILDMKRYGIKATGFVHKV